jgi:hypothetical protein
MVGQGNNLNRGGGHRRARRASLEALATLGLIALGILAASPASAGAEPLRLIYAPGKIVPIPASIPHEEGDMVDRRIIPDLRLIASRFPIYITDGYSGPLPGGELVGCDRCHTRNSDHYNGLAVDIVPASGTSGRCEGQWNAITRLAHWAEPVQNHPIAPFRWVGYDGDRGHGCGHHLHLSWNHAPAAEYRLADWVEVFSSGAGSKLPTQSGRRPPSKKSPPGPSGGISQFQPGGVSARD